MPGIAGFCGPTDQADQAAADRLLASLIDSMRDEQGYQVDSFACPGLGLARLHLGLIDARPQPVWSADGNVALVMTGEIFSWDMLHLDHAPTGKEADFSNADLLLAAYQAHGPRCVDHVNGTFAAAIWNERERTLLLINDHLGTYPIYFAQVQDCLVWGSGARAAAQAPGLLRSVNTAAVAEMLAFGQVFGDKTLFAGVHLLRPGSVLQFAAGKLSISKYADWQYAEYYELHSEEYYIDRWSYYMRQAVARQTRPPAPIGVLLTGGLDSRSIFGMMDHDSLDTVAMTFGVPGCDDDRFAREMAAHCRVPYKFIPLAPDYLACLGAKAVRLTDGMKGCVHFNMIGALDQVVQAARVLYKGYLGGTIYGHVVTHERLAPVRDDEWFEQVLAARNRVFPEAELPHLCSAEMLRQVGDIPRQSLRQALAQSRSTWWVDKDSYIDLYEEDVRFTSLGVELARSQAIVRTPLADKDLVQFALSVPPGYRVNKEYYKHAIVKALPGLAKIPYDVTGLPLHQNSFRSLGMRANEQMRWWLRDRGLNWIPVPRRRPYADYDAWLRHELRPWVEATLLSPEALDRGYYQPKYIRNLIAEHMAGCDHSFRLGVLLSLELWHQQFIN